MSKNVPIIGLLGGVCSGKSTAAKALAGLGCAVIDADAIAHEMLDRQDIKQSIREQFGGGVFDENGDISRKKLAEKVFGDEQSVKKINSIIHPPVIRRCEELIEHYKSQQNVEGIVLDVPLLAETGAEKKCDVLIFIDCPEEKRAFLAQKKGLGGSESQKNREKFQISLDKKREMAQYIASNKSDLSAFTEQVTKIFTNIKS